MQPNELKRLAAGADRRAQELSRDFERVAADRGLLDVGYGFAESPFGRLLVAVTDRGLVTLAYPNEEVGLTLERLATRVSPRIIESARATERIRRELDEYFEGRRKDFDVGVDWALTGGFGRKILAQTARIPYGSVATYREVAERAGSPRGMRAAGNALGANPVPIVVPCHRVVNTGGGLGGYTGGLDRKITLLSLEGALEPDVGRASRAGARRRPFARG